LLSSQANRRQRGWGLWKLATRVGYPRPPLFNRAEWKRQRELQLHPGNRTTDKSGEDADSRADPVSRKARLPKRCPRSVPSLSAAFAMVDNRLSRPLAPGIFNHGILPLAPAPQLRIPSNSCSEAGNSRERAAKLSAGPRMHQQLTKMFSPRRCECVSSTKSEHRKLP
jgi:hypothetical protein